MRPEGLKTKIFLDGGDPKETREIISLLGFLDGQTTNPTLIAKNPEVRARLDSGNKFGKKELLKFYKETVEEISGLIPEGSVSIEVYSDKDTSAGEMFDEGREMFGWIPNAHIKFPITKEGLGAAERAVWEGMRVNMTLCFTEEQAAAVYAATKGASRGDVFISPFVGRLDDIGLNGMDLIKNIVQLYGQGLALGEQGESNRHAPTPNDVMVWGHVEVLAASVRTMDHFFESIRLGADIITAPHKILKEWAEKGMAVPDESFIYNAKKLKSIPYRGLSLEHPWESYDISHDLTEKGVERFATDWNALL